MPEPGPGQVLVKVGGAGACHSDLHLMEAPAERPRRCPSRSATRTRGGSRSSAPAPTGFAPGDPVLVYGPWGCGTCANCRLGMENYCEATGGLGGGLAGNDGGMAPYLLVPSTRFLIPLGTLDPREAAPLTDAALTSYHAVKRSLHLLGAGLDRGGDRGGRPRPDGHPDPACAQLVHDRRRRGHRGRQARDRRAHGRGRDAALR